MALGLDRCPSFRESSRPPGLGGLCSGPLVLNTLSPAAIRGLGAWTSASPLGTSPWGARTVPLMFMHLSSSQNRERFLESQGDQLTPRLALNAPHLGPHPPGSTRTESKLDQGPGGGLVPTGCRGNSGGRLRGVGIHVRERTRREARASKAALEGISGFPFIKQSEVINQKSIYRHSQPAITGSRGQGVL